MVEFLITRTSNREYKTISFGDAQGTNSVPGVPTYLNLSKTKLISRVNKKIKKLKKKITEKTEP
jgi:hypothetical protein